MITHLEELISDAKQIGCIDALSKHDHNISYLMDEKRASYIDLIGLKPSDDVLEIGSSMGQHARLMAAQCKTLSGLEVVPLQAAFSKLWCGEDGLQNVNVTAGGMSGKMPYDDASFDVVTCNYVLEWCAGRHDGDPRAFHQAFLAEIYRVLKPNGRLYLSTKNRYSIRYVLGDVDEHLGMRFGSALPRICQNLFRKPANLDHPTGYLHSWEGLEEILNTAGFHSNERILAFPDARYPEYIGRFLDFTESDIPQAALSAVRKKTKLSLKLPAPAFRKTTNSLVFLATK